MILPFFFKKHFYIYNGKSNISLDVNLNMIGHKLGEFSSSKISMRYTHLKKSKKKSSKHKKK